MRLSKKKKEKERKNKRKKREKKRGEEKNENKDRPCSHKKIFQVPMKREISFNEHSRITLATKYST